MTKRDERARAEDALARWQDQHTKAYDVSDSATDALAIGVDWLRAEIALAKRLWPAEWEWTDILAYQAAGEIMKAAAQLADEMRGDIKKHGVA